MKRFFRRLLVGLAWSIGVVVWLTFIQWSLICPVYNFPPAKSFEGSKWFNPYDDVIQNDWKLCNFQVQSKAWAGITNGRNNSVEDIESTYKELGYDALGISDYMSINKKVDTSRFGIKMYEHGYGIMKHHQLCLGAEEVWFYDFPVFQCTHSKQFIIDQLRTQTEVLAIAHPALLNAYDTSDMERLTGYDLIEALNHIQFSLPQWDAALSAGRPVYIIANDDNHDIANPYLYGRLATVVASNVNTEDQILTALKEGKAYGLEIYTPNGETHELKVERFADLPHLNQCSLKGDTVSLACSQTIHHVKVMHQNGKIFLDSTITEDTEQISFSIANAMAYARIEVEAGKKHVLYLNPIMKSTTGEKPILELAYTNSVKTSYRRIMGLAFLLLTGAFSYRRIQRRTKVWEPIKAAFIRPKWMRPSHGVRKLR
jgi:hypothetical protein